MTFRRPQRAPPPPPPLVLTFRWPGRNTTDPHDIKSNQPPFQWTSGQLSHAINSSVAHKTLRELNMTTSERPTRFQRSNQKPDEISSSGVCCVGDSGTKFTKIRSVGRWVLLRITFITLYYFQHFSPGLLSCVEKNINVKVIHLCILCDNEMREEKLKRIVVRWIISSREARGIPENTKTIRLYYFFL